MTLWSMDDPVEPDDAAWPPAVFRPAGPSPTNPPRLVARRFELVDVGADAAGRTASIDIVVLGRVWVVVGCVGPSAEWISRLVAEVAVDAVRHGAARLTVLADARAALAAGDDGLFGLPLSIVELRVRRCHRRAGTRFGSEISAEIRRTGQTGWQPVLDAVQGG